MKSNYHYWHSKANNGPQANTTLKKTKINIILRNWTPNKFKGIAYDFFLVRNTQESFAAAKQNTFKSKQNKTKKNPHKIAEIMKKRGFLAHFNL